MFDEQTLASHLDRLGWPYHPHGSGTWRCTHSTNEGQVDIYLRLGENWLIASVVPFLPTRGKNSFELARWLLRQNRDLLQAKFAYDEDGDVVLSAEIPTESMDFEEVEAVLVGLLREAVRHRAILREEASPR